MNRSATVKIFAAGMLVLFVLPLLAFPLSAAVPAEMAGGCHGHHKPTPTPTPSHNCCYARPQPPAQVQVVPSATPLQVVHGFAVPHDLQKSDIVLVAPSDADLSPPPQLI